MEYSMVQDSKEMSIQICQIKNIILFVKLRIKKKGDCNNFIAIRWKLYREFNDLEFDQNVIKIRLKICKFIGRI